MPQLCRKTSFQDIDIFVMYRILAVASILTPFKNVFGDRKAAFGLVWRKEQRKEQENAVERKRGEV